MITIKYEVQTSIKVPHQEILSVTEVDELRNWLIENIGKPYVDWNTSVNRCKYVCVTVSTREQATFVALKWS